MGMEAPRTTLEHVPETIVSKLHRMVLAAGGRYEDWHIGVRGRLSAKRVGLDFEERASSPAVAALIVDHFARLGAKGEKTWQLDGDQVFAQHVPGDWAPRPERKPPQPFVRGPLFFRL